MARVRIDDVEQACKLREAGLLWRSAGAGEFHIGHTAAWTPKCIRAVWDDANSYGYFFIVVED